ncbi:unnamed protein product [Durusdinium trenchii]|uniref:Methyltransferase type 11 domain-containing protein n=1 Tax=Durusdinium trenchii TaxID=1381693 RepID=A0ABP0PTX4_9DINO
MAQRSSASSLAYWEEFYADRPKSYDTLYGYEDLRPLLMGLLQLPRAQREACRVLHVGCGTSNVTEGLWRDGFRQILNIDFSEEVVKLMAGRWDERAAGNSAGVAWQKMDLTDLSELCSGTFDLVLEKFTLDAILCESKEELVDPKGQAVLRGLHRVLAPAGRFISVAWGADRRQALLRSGGLFEVQVHQLPGEAVQRPWVYFCRKLAPIPRRMPRLPDTMVQCIEEDEGLQLVIELGDVCRSSVQLDLASHELHLSTPSLGQRSASWRAWHIRLGGASAPKDMASGAKELLGDEKVSVEEALKDKKAGDMARGREGIEQSRHFDVHVWVESKGTYRASG